MNKSNNDTPTTDSELTSTMLGILYPDRQESFDNLINGIACHYELVGKGITASHAADKYTIEYVYDQLRSYIEQQKLEAVNDFVSLLNEQNPYVPLDGTPRQYVEQKRLEFIAKLNQKTK